MKNRIQPFTIESNIQVHGTVHEVTSAVGALIIIHDVGEQRFQYQPLIDYYNSKQLIVVTYDLRGHHHSLDNGLVGHFQLEELVSDLKAVVQRINDEYDNLPISVLAGKLSGWIVYQALEEIEISKLILVGTLKRPSFLAVRRFLINLMPKKKTSWLGSKMLFNLVDNEEQKVHQSVHLTNGGYVACCDLLMSQIKRISLPLSILMIGTADDRHQFDTLKQFYQACGIYNCEVLIGENISLEKMMQFIILE